jgi:cellulose synthase/poly-beta-1,6-N-acetylglucosamine synthase-like glycosyltransferase
MNGWDAYNVTEDAEISVRAIKHCYKIKTLNSITLEESVKDLKSWIKQRKRWIKGYIQTYLQHSVNFISFYKKVGFKKFFLFHYIVGFSFAIPIFYLFFIISYIFYFDSFTQNQLLINRLIYNFYIFSNIIMILFLIKRDNKIKLKNILDTILYILYSHIYVIIVYLTIIELIKKPFIWNKTEHNRSIYN